jgi:hypothetical protein
MDRPYNTIFVFLGFKNLWTQVTENAKLENPGYILLKFEHILMICVYNYVF